MHQHTNLLINETSPYLLQHAHNPVQWHAWGKEALDKAKREDKPVLVSIGYAACHWCHVMERESFENEETAAIMNAHFINIKIDREERPDIDHIYMDALQAMTGSGGWPLNVFLLPDGRPFYGGTYFPPVKAYGRSSWTEILIAVSNAYKTRRGELENQAFNLTQHLKQSNEFKVNDTAENSIFTHESVNTIVDNLLEAADKTWGGFGAAPKFPQTFSLQFLLRNYYYTNNSEALKHVTLSLKKMLDGGLYDHLKGGFARYSTDERWFAPHFEKMLYDNALLIITLSETYQLTKDPVFRNAIDETLQWINDELTDPEGVCYSAIDADSEGVEGKFYIWTKSEVEKVLQEDAPLFCSFYNITNEGNWEHANILWIEKSVAEYAIDNGYNEHDLCINLNRSKEKLLAVRNNRVRPLLDDKVIVGWNALMNIAYCKAFAAIGNEQYKTKAIKNMETLEKYFKNSSTGLWSHTYKNGIAKYPAFLDDYAYLINAYIHLQEITSDQDYLIKAKEMVHLVFEHFDDDESAHFYYTGASQNDVIIRKKEIYDGATPSANSIMAVNLYYLSVIFENPDWRKRVESMINNIADSAIKYPTSFGVWSSVIQDLVYGIPEIVLTGIGLNENLKNTLSHFIPGRILQSSAIIHDKFPLLKDKDFSHENFIYVCKNQVCSAPVLNFEQVKTLLK